MSTVPGMVPFAFPWRGCLSPSLVCCKPDQPFSLSCPPTTKQPLRNLLHEELLLLLRRGRRRRGRRRRRRRRVIPFHVGRVEGGARRESTGIARRNGVHAAVGERVVVAAPVLVGGCGGGCGGRHHDARRGSGRANDAVPAAVESATAAPVAPRRRRGRVATAATAAPMVSSVEAGRGGTGGRRRARDAPASCWCARGRPSRRRAAGSAGPAGATAAVSTT